MPTVVCVVGSVVVGGAVRKHLKLYDPPVIYFFFRHLEYIVDVICYVRMYSLHLPKGTYTRHQIYGGHLEKKKKRVRRIRRRREKGNVI